MVVGAVTRAARAKEGLAALRRVVASILDMVGGEKEATRMLALAIYSFCSSTSTIKYSNGMRRELGQSRIFRVM